MKAFANVIELMAIGLGGLIAWVLAVFLILKVEVEVMDDPSIYYFLIDEGLSLSLLVLPFLAIVLGLIIDGVGAVLFSPWQASLRKSIQPLGAPNAGKGKKLTTDYYYQVRNYIYASEKSTALAQEISNNRSRIRLSRAWAVNALLIVIPLLIAEAFHEGFDPIRFPLISTAVLIFLACLIVWYGATTNELKWMGTFNEALLM